MWDMRRNLVPSLLPDRRCTVKFTYPELSAGRKSWWIVSEDGEVDLCSVDPGYDIDLYVSGSLHAMTAVWMGVSTLEGRARGRQHRIDRRQGGRAFDAAMAGPQSVRRGKEPGGVGRISQGAARTRDRWRNPPHYAHRRRVTPCTFACGATANGVRLTRPTSYELNQAPCFGRDSRTRLPVFPVA